MLANSPMRNPKRLIFASSPDRGLLPLLLIFQRAKELVPDLELHVYYGFNNMETAAKWIAQRAPNKANKPSAAEYNLAKLRDALDMPGVTVHGRTAQPELARAVGGVGNLVPPVLLHGNLLHHLYGCSGIGRHPHHPSHLGSG